MSSKVNSSGLEPTESKNLTERSAQTNEQPIVVALKEMYSCQPKDYTFSIYAKDAVFHDPIGIANGIDSIRSQFFGLAKIFPRADIPKFRLLQNPPSVPPSTILIDQDVAYFRDPMSSSPTKVVNSLLILKLDGSNKVISHDEEWDHSKNKTSEDGFFGMLNEERKKLTAKLTDTVVGGGDKNKN